eukprot:CAMPEP_0206008246 /NCGR_PEP_ID=MMETSP1464-20131121/7070_1 /ASSEMBLY_ACC=CAM_ASM_001124 /TAXON_ID=119497 /ORGANISM="Exanthemachrysis gayraliae, Strain RCC1523" /LENGTH=256 /DNA_ID=CAMNT_0053381777 /DNA_START=159 /DNA_END=926 /DNA_ORIENTATION=-
MTGVLQVDAVGGATAVRPSAPFPPSRAPARPAADLARGHLLGEALGAAHVPAGEHHGDHEADDGPRDDRAHVLGGADDGSVDDEGDGEADAEEEDEQDQAVEDLESPGPVVVNGVEPVDEDSGVDEEDGEVDGLQHVVGRSGGEGLRRIVLRLVGLRGELGLGRLRGVHGPENHLQDGADDADEDEDDEDDGPELHAGVEAAAAAGLGRTAAAEAQHEVQGRLLLNVVVGERASVLQLLACKDEPLLVRGDALLVL